MSEDTSDLVDWMGRFKNEPRIKELEAQLAEVQAVLRQMTWIRADEVPTPCFHPADAYRWAFCICCKTWSRADQPNDPTKLHAPDCRLAKVLEET